MDTKKTPFLTLSPLGGLGEIGMNCMVLETAESMVVIDCGLMFPDDFHYGVDVVIPRFDFILKRKEKLKGIVITHGHEDHIGALPWLMPFVNAPVFSSEFTLSLIRNKLVEHNLAEYVQLNPVKPDSPVQIGDFTFHFFPVCHSIIHGYGLGIETPLGKVVHTGDFKIDRNPLHGHATDLDSFRRFAGDDVLLLLSDSTNVERDGYALTEREIQSSLKDLFGRAEGRILVTLFSSHIQRMQEIFDLAAETGRKVAISGRSLSKNVELANSLGLLTFSDENFTSLELLPRYKDEEMVLLVSGSQGEPLSAMSRLAAGDHRQLRIQPGDTVIMSSRFIPGNTKAITKVINNLYRLGAQVLYEKVQAIHASGHAHRQELETMCRTVSPKFFVPIHGEYRHLFKHAQMAKECGVAPERALVLEDGEPVTFLPGSIRFDDKIFCEQVLVDGKGVGDVGYSVLKERQILGEEGMVVVVLVLDKETGEIIIGPDINSKGFVFEQHYSHVLEDAKCIILDIYENIPPGATDRMTDRIRSSLRRFFRKVLERDPVVVPIIKQV
ncbi:MAG: ribonuclease J [Desulfovibrionales bacterium]